MRQVLAIDIGTSQAKVLAGKAVDGKVEILASAVAPMQGYYKGKFEQIPAVVAAVRQAVECVTTAVAGPFECTYVGIGAAILQSDNLEGSVAPMQPQNVSESDVERACRASVAALSSEQAVLHIIPVEYSLDKQVYKEFPQGKACHSLRVKTHVISMPKALKSQLNAELARQSIPVSGFVANSYAALLGLKEEIKQQDALIFDLGAGTADVSLLRQGQLVLSTSLPYGGDYITSDLSQAFSVTLEQAEGIKKYYAKLDKGLYRQNIMLDCDDSMGLKEKIAYDFLHDIIESRTEELVYLMREDIKNYLPQEADVWAKAAVYMTGGCAQLSSFIEQIENSLP
ncbi:MAG: cell division FtsA domain-containing protein [Sporomusaceae bacterium]|nr:cell division FtsA domain-containing protein [Sporomusaceae bacterium]